MVLISTHETVVCLPVDSTTFDEYMQNTQIVTVPYGSLLRVRACLRLFIA